VDKGWKHSKDKYAEIDDRRGVAEFSKMRIPERLETYYTHAEFCKSFVHPIRLAILDSLREGEQTVTQLVEKLGIRQSTISQQLSFLRRLGVVRTKRDGQRVYYDLADRRVLKAYDLVDEVIASTRIARAEIYAHR
jgi:DNA-binding transcriptional ArsR family regulator